MPSPRSSATRSRQTPPRPPWAEGRTTPSTGRHSAAAALRRFCASMFRHCPPKHGGPLGRHQIDAVNRRPFGRQPRSRRGSCRWRRGCRRWRGLCVDSHAQRCHRYRRQRARHEPVDRHHRTRTPLCIHGSLLRFESTNRRTCELSSNFQIRQFVKIRKFVNCHSRRKLLP